MSEFQDAQIPEIASPDAADIGKALCGLLFSIDLQGHPIDVRLEWHPERGGRWRVYVEEEEAAEQVTIVESLTEARRWWNERMRRDHA